MKDIFGTTIMAIQALAPDLRFTVTSNEDGNPNWSTFIVDDTCEGMYVPSQEEIEHKRQEIIADGALRHLRMARDQLIVDTDWWMLPDRSPSEAQLTYRQALRDITKTYTSLDDVIWPIRPV